MSVAETARRLNVSRPYVRNKLFRKRLLMPVLIWHGRHFLLRAKVEAYRQRRRRIGLKALREMARMQQEAGTYENLPP